MKSNPTSSAPCSKRRYCVPQLRVCQLQSEQAILSGSTSAANEQSSPDAYIEWDNSQGSLWGE